MNARKYSEAMSICLKHGIRIYPSVYARGRYKIVVERQGKPKEGDEIYDDAYHINKETKEKIPPIYIKIHEMYQSIANNIINHKLSTINNQGI